ncbi:unnamed protein product [Dovyalis caffra]|uniref:Uncharacterized protein n=1 Tax=Dovyalis caffra TaxID=77055 RepID=A0AAV1RMC0_9ROSI|nr:unnamed protein product [Dovyalis caffra]
MGLGRGGGRCRGVLKMKRSAIDNGGSSRMCQGMPLNTLEAVEGAVLVSDKLDAVEVLVDEANKQVDIGEDGADGLLA